ncbi:uncharacterized protein [Antedon mediterranea]|uniref:uncharacterized protein n=1 Tax=Antedon mediterranea TaxID=105859 RepID=UPI003AF6D9A2
MENKYFCIFLTFASVVVLGSCVNPDTPPKSGNWTFKDCMKMTFGARFTIPVTYNNGTNSTVDVDLASYAMFDESTCDAQSAKLLLRFYLSPSDSRLLWKFILDFIKDGGKYKLDTVTLQYVVDNHFPTNIKRSGQMFNEKTKDYQPSAEIGSYIGCDKVEFNLGLSPIGVSMFNVKMQPFAQAVSGGGYGTKTECEAPPAPIPTGRSPTEHIPTGPGPTGPSPTGPSPTGPSPTGTPADSGGSKTTLIVVCVVIAVVAVLLIVGGILFVVLQRGNKNTYKYTDIRY